MKKSDRMNCHHICVNCGIGFTGFKFQTTCWKCVGNYVNSKFYKDCKK